jgi:NTP pyrophosphatase (non-canonical NTP hydrolase)
MTDLEFIDYLEDLASQAYTTSFKHGFHENYANDLKVPTSLALIHSEVSEALEAHRHGEGIGEELADIVIRTLDLAAAEQLNLGKLILEKMQKNKLRPYLHGGKRY